MATLKRATKGGFLTLAEMMGLSEEELERRKKLLQFDVDDEERLKSLSSMSETKADEIIEQFYQHLLSFEEMQTFFPDEKTLKHVKEKQKAYFVRLTKGKYDLDYAENRLRVGATHEKIRLPLKYYLAMYNFYLRIAGNYISELGKEDKKISQESFTSLMKLTFLDISLAIDTYMNTREQAISALQDETIRELSTPVLLFRKGLLLLPLIGQIDSRRARQLTEHMLEAIRANRARVIVIDITGVATVDSRVANHLVQTVEAAQLMGAEVVISGISPDIALTMVTLGIDLGPVHTVGDLQNGIEHGERLLGYKVIKITELGNERTKENT